MDDKAGALTLVVGGTGSLGGRVVKALLSRGQRLRALVREGTDAQRLLSQGVEIARGDLLDPASLTRAMQGVSAVVTTANGYTKRRPGDSLATVDGQGNRNLIDAAKAAGVKRFVFTSILACDQAPGVPHFWQKKLTEDYLQASGVPFISMRPGAIIGMEGRTDFWARDLKKGRLTAIGDEDARWTWVHIEDVARCLALAVEEPRAEGKRVDLGMDRAFSVREAADAFSELLGRPVRLRHLPWTLVGGIAGMVGLLNPFVRDMRAMLEFFFTGRYVADTHLQAELFGPVPSVEDTFRRYLNERGLSVTRTQRASEAPQALGRMG